MPGFILREEVRYLGRLFPAGRGTHGGFLVTFPPHAVDASEALPPFRALAVTRHALESSQTRGELVTLHTILK